MSTEKKKKWGGSRYTTPNTSLSTVHILQRKYINVQQIHLRDTQWQLVISTIDNHHRISRVTNHFPSNYISYFWSGKASYFVQWCRKEIFHYATDYYLLKQSTHFRAQTELVEVLGKREGIWLLVFMFVFKFKGKKRKKAHSPTHGISIQN